MQTFQLQSVTSNLGCVAPDTVVEFGGDLLFLGPDGIRPISGTDRIGDVELAPVSKEIQDIFDNYYLSELITDVSIVVIRKKSQFRFFFKNDSSLSLIGAIRKSRINRVYLSTVSLLVLKLTVLLWLHRSV